MEGRPHAAVEGGGVGGLVSQLCLTPATPWTTACQSPLSIGFPRQEYWTAISFSNNGK